MNRIRKDPFVPVVVLSFLLLFPILINAEEYVAISREQDVPVFDLPDPPVFENGERVSSPADWDRRRGELILLFEKNVYGKTVLGRPEEMRFEVTKGPIPFLAGKASLTEIRIHFTSRKEGLFLDLLLIKPQEILQYGVPTFVALNF